MTFTLLEEDLLLLLFVSFVCSVCLFFTIVKTGIVFIKVYFHIRSYIFSYAVYSLNCVIWGIF